MHPVIQPPLSYSGSPLLGTTPTGVFSAARRLYPGFTGALYTDAGGGAISSFTDQVGTGNMTDGGTSTRRPTLTTAGPNSVPALGFDGASDWLTSGAVQISSYLGADDKYIVLSFVPNVVDTSADIAVCNGNGRVQLYVIETTSTDRARVANFDVGASDIVTIDNPAGAATLLSLRHEGGTLYGRLNGVEATGVASGSTTFGANALNFGAQNGAAHINMSLVEVLLYTTIPAEAKRHAIEANLGAFIGAF